MSDFLSCYSIQNWLESCPQGYLDGMQYGHAPEERESELILTSDTLREDAIRAIGRILRDRAKDQDEVHVLLGDMNTENRDGPGTQALLDLDFILPDLGPTALSGDKWYDQITFVGPQDESHLINKGVIPWQEAVFTDNEAADYEKIAMDIRTGADAGKPYANWPAEYPSWRTHEMSDHLPVWIEIEVDYSNAYLRRIGDMAPSAG